ncbi:MAG: DUF3179 domain-containing protein [Candidatus Diapherotrites archaeon]|nr:DUF3179 domain-containing protein [Candidatus Diapherotrites archaeon]
MNKLFIAGIAIVVLIFIALFFLIANGINAEPLGSSNPNLTGQDKIPFEQKFLLKGLLTNTALRSIELSKVLSGGPGRDGIPAINRPVFVPVNEKPASVSFDTQGIVLGKQEPKFYPYNIMIWHEIVNDTVDGVPVAVTFCPLCGSAVVFDRRVGNETLSFGVSGLLYESNLLMYDSKTDSLWSQVLGKAVIGDYLGTELKLLPSNVLPLGDFARLYPYGLVLSDKTGFLRDYSFNPYANYDQNPELFFPVGDFDNRLPPKELVFVVPLENQTVAFVLSKLNEKKSATVSVNGQELRVVVGDAPYSATFDGKEKPGFVAMYFSVGVHNPDMVIWNGD